MEIKTNLTAIEWYEAQIWDLQIKLENKEISIGEYGVTRVELFNKAKQIEAEGLNRLNQYWVESREQAVHVAKRIGFRKGVELGFLNADHYWHEHEKFQNESAFKDETEFNDNYINELWNDNNK